MIGVAFIIPSFYLLLIHSFINFDATKIDIYSI
nr:MAG TPA: hypothetical protein [Caudoviricetes sp.]